MSKHETLKLSGGRPSIAKILAALAFVLAAVYGAKLFVDSGF